MITTMTVWQVFLLVVLGSCIGTIIARIILAFAGAVFQVCVVETLRKRAGR